MKYLCQPLFAYIKKRPQYLNVSSRNKRFITKGFVALVQWNETGTVNIGFTASKKVGNAVIRNNARRRLKATVDKHIRLNEKFNTKGANIVFIARYGIGSMDYTSLEADMKQMLVGAKCTL